MKRGAWAAFWLVALIWGSSFLLIRIGLLGFGLFSAETGAHAGFRTAEIVFVRTFIAALGLGAVIALRRVPLPRDWHTWRALVIIGLGNVVAPFLLITWSEQYITSGLAAVLQSTAALFTLVIAHFTFADERISIQKIVGLLLGFVGVIVLFGGEMGGENSVAGMFGMVLASLCYATFTSYSRRVIQGDVAPIVVAGVTISVAAIATAPLALLGEGGFTPLAQVSSDALVSVIVLGLLNTFVAYLFYYFIVRELGAARASMVTYVVPVVGVILGTTFLQEVVGLTLLLGGGLIFAGIAIVNLRRRQRVRLAQAVEQGAKP
jgi:drug/metabolite transporter (DMT)-like permease